MNTETVIDTVIEPVIDTVIEFLQYAGLEVEVVYNGPPNGCPGCSSKELTAAA